MGCCRKKSVPQDADGGVKLLSEKTVKDDNFQNERSNSESIPVEVESFSIEFRELLRMN